MNLPKPMQHHSLQPRPQHIRHPMHQAPIHPGHPGHPPPHLAINMGPPPTPQQQPPLHIPNGPQARGPLPQQYSLQQMRDQSRLTHPQLAQQMTQQMQNQMQHHKGRQPLGGAPMKHAMMQKSFQTAAMRNNTQPNQKLQQQRLPMPPQVLPMNGGCGAAQIQLMKANMQNQQPQLQQIQQQQQQQQQIGQQQQKSNAIPIQQMPNINRQQTHQQQQQRPLLPPNNQKHSSSNRSRPNNRQTQQNPVHPRQILQNPNRANHLHKANVSTPTTLPTVSEVESTVVGTAQKSEELSATAEDFKPQNNQETSENEKANEEDNGLLSDFLSVVMKSKNCFTNSKEKTPMCLVNELARYNKIEHQYRLTGETGPAHCKRFTVTLKLGTEEYTAEGYKIKKAQHTAAAEAIKKTKYKHPLPKIIRRPEGTLRATITPSVELNALAMKLGQQTYYVFDQRSQQEPSPVSQDISEAGPVTNERLSGVGMLPQQQRFIAGKVFPPKYPMRIPSVNGYAPQPGHLTNGVSTELCKITLFVGKQKFVGCGKTLQAAKHDAASQALQILKAEAAKFKEILSRTPEDGDWKSPISLVHEIAIKRNLNVVFKVLREEGPAHMKNFITTCEVGNIITEGDGNGKKISKKRAAEKMLKELIKLPPPSPSKSPPVKRIKVKNFKRKTSPSTKKRGSSSIRDKSDAECEEETNPISKLIQIQQSRNEKGPVYELVARNGETKKKEFVIEVNVPGKVARGIGASKKLAKRSAAQNLLIAMGVETEDNANQENDSQIANQNPTVNCSRKVKFSEGNETTDRGSDTNTAVQSGNGGPSGRQIVPGVLLLRQHSKDTDETDHSAETSDNSRKDQTQSASPTTASEKSATTTTTTSSSSGGGVRPKDQLMYLAQILGFQVNYSDYPKGNHNEFLTIVTLSTSPPQICHGMGMNVEESQDQAASATLQILSKLGLDNVKPKTED